jgi:hypothetical protein
LPRNGGGNWYLKHPGIAPWVLDFIEECPNGQETETTRSQSKIGTRHEE